jgi:hypothetical protein|tara:strand:- start:196 stop:444 length:249 start_codon:yes stop_codon:yes gene_type:complete
MQLPILLSALFLSVSPVLADVDPARVDVFKEACVGSEKMEDGYRIQKSKYCDCMSDFIFFKQTEKPFGEVVEICKNKYPPLH